MFNQHGFQAMPTSPNERREPVQTQHGATDQPHDGREPVQTQHGATYQPHDGRVTVAPARPGKLVRLPVVEDRTGLGKSSIYAGVKARTFPAPVRLSARAVAWRESDVDQWIAERTTARGQS